MTRTDIMTIKRRAREYRIEGPIIPVAQHTINRQANIDDFILKSIEMFADALLEIKDQKPRKKHDHEV